MITELKLTNGKTQSLLIAIYSLLLTVSILSLFTPFGPTVFIGCTCVCSSIFFSYYIYSRRGLLG